MSPRAKIRISHMKEEKGPKFPRKKGFSVRRRKKSVTSRREKEKKSSHGQATGSTVDGLSLRNGVLEK